MADQNKVVKAEEEEEDAEPEWVSFSKRPEWKDVTPVQQDEGPFGGACPIAYEARFKETFDYFRAVVNSGETSQRVFDLIGEAIRLNPANYTTWYYRRLLFSKLDKTLASELDWTTEVAKENPKNYQIWYHRKSLIESELKKYNGDKSQLVKNLDVTKIELDFTEYMLGTDNKNYHAWSHRQWVITDFNLFEQEYGFIDKMLASDFKNNSAWNQRWFIVNKGNVQGGGKFGLLSEEQIQKEVDFAWPYLQKHPNNQCPWNYIAGVIRGCTGEQRKQLKERVVEFRAKYISCPHACSLLIDFGEEEGTKESLEGARQNCLEMATKLAQIHSKYWFYRATQLEDKIAKI